MSKKLRISNDGTGYEQEKKIEGKVETFWESVSNFRAKVCYRNKDNNPLKPHTIIEGFFIFNSEEVGFQMKPNTWYDDKKLCMQIYKQLGIRAVFSIDNINKIREAATVLDLEEKEDSTTKVHRLVLGDFFAAVEKAIKDGGYIVNRDIISKRKCQEIRENIIGFTHAKKPGVLYILAHNKEILSILSEVLTIDTNKFGTIIRDSGLLSENSGERSHKRISLKGEKPYTWAINLKKLDKTSLSRNVDIYKCNI